MSSLKALSSVESLDELLGLWWLILGSVALLALALFVIQYFVYFDNSTQRVSNLKNKIFQSVMSLILITLFIGGGAGLLVDYLSKNVTTTSGEVSSSLNINNSNYDFKIKKDQQRVMEKDGSDLELSDEQAESIERHDNGEYSDEELQAKQDLEESWSNGLVGKAQTLWNETAGNFINSAKKTVVSTVRVASTAWQVSKALLG